LVIITVRPETELPFAGLANVDNIELEPLDRAATGAMITELSRGHVLSATTVRQIIMKSGGIPLFIQELTKALLEAEQLRDTSGHHQQLDALREFVIPDTLQVSLHTRLDRLGGAKELAKIAAVIGIEFHHRHIAALAGYDEPALQSALQALIDSGFLSAL
jgi:predicted ATPase